MLRYQRKNWTVMGILFVPPDLPSAVCHLVLSSPRNPMAPACLPLASSWVQPKGACMLGGGCGAYFSHLLPASRVATVLCLHLRPRLSEVPPTATVLPRFGSSLHCSPNSAFIKYIYIYSTP